MARPELPGVGQAGLEEGHLLPPQLLFAGVTLPFPTTFLSLRWAFWNWNMCS